MRLWRPTAIACWITFYICPPILNGGVFFNVAEKIGAPWLLAFFLILGVNVIWFRHYDALIGKRLFPHHCVKCRGQNCTTLTATVWVNALIEDLNRHARLPFCVHCFLKHRAKGEIVKG